MNPLLQVENLHVSFSFLSKTTKAVRNVSFELFPGEVIGVVGESGCGKTAMARSITGLISFSNGKIEKGSVFFKGENLLLKSQKELQAIRGKEIGMIFQDPMNSLNPTMKIGKQIMESYLCHHPGTSRKTAKRRALELLKKVGISQEDIRFHQYPHQLSGGIRQRVMIAISIVSSPMILIADEPTTALDVTIQAQFLNLLKDIQKKENMSILFITHNLGIVAGFCNRVLVMYAGEIIERATADQFFSSPKHPYAKRLLRSVPRLDLPSKKKLYAISGMPPSLTQNIRGCSFALRCPLAMPVCYKQPPPLFKLETSHQVNCWLYNTQQFTQGRKNDKSTSCANTKSQKILQT